MQCPVGEVCLGDTHQCVAFTPAYLPKPEDSKELLSRLGSLVFTLPEETTPGLITMEVVVLNEHRFTLAHPLAAGTARARMDGDLLRVWSLRVAADGGGVSVGDDASTIDVYVIDLTLESAGEASGVLSMESYPTSSMETDVSMLLKARIGARADNLAPIEWTIENAALKVRFDVAENVLVADLAFTGEWKPAGVEDLIRVENIRVATRFSGVELPQAWAR